MALCLRTLGLWGQCLATGDEKKNDVRQPPSGGWKRGRVRWRKRRSRKERKETANEMMVVTLLGLRCPQCSSLPTPDAKIFQCTQGHLICNNCQLPDRDWCRKCDQPTEMHRSLVAEKLMKSDVYDNKAKKILTPTVDQLTSALELECPCCLDIPEGKVVQCSNGHSICKACCKKLAVKECPSCRVRFTKARPPARCMIVENLISHFELLESD